MVCGKEAVHLKYLCIWKSGYRSYPDFTGVAQIKIQIQIWCANNQSHFSDFQSFTAK